MSNRHNTYATTLFMLSYLACCHEMLQLKSNRTYFKSVVFHTARVRLIAFIWNKIQFVTAARPCHKEVVVGICAMAKKSQSKPMKEILSRLNEFKYIRTVVFEEQTILEEPVSNWPLCDCLISFHSKGHRCFLIFTQNFFAEPKQFLIIADDKFSGGDRNANAMTGSAVPNHDQKQTSCRWGASQGLHAHWTALPRL